jgi:hypothetical protein
MMNLNYTLIRPEMLPNQHKILDESKQYIIQLLSKQQNTLTLRDAYAHKISPLMLANVEEAARLQVSLLHAQVSAWRERMDSVAFRSLYVVIGSSHQARYGQLSVQYFDKVFKETSGNTALTENHVVVAEGLQDEKKCLSLLARHLIDQEIGLSFFDDPFRMQRDLLSDGAAKFIDPLFPATKKE